MKFDKKEIENAKMPDFSARRMAVEFDSPITPRENLKLAFQKKQLWMPSASDKGWFCPHIIPDNPARAFVIQGAKYDGPVGGNDMFAAMPVPMRIYQELDGTGDSPVTVREGHIWVAGLQSRKSGTGKNGGAGSPGAR